MDHRAPRHGRTVRSALQPLLRDQAERAESPEGDGVDAPDASGPRRPIALQRRRLARIGHGADATQSDLANSLILGPGLSSAAESPLDPRRRETPMMTISQNLCRAHADTGQPDGQGQ